jgi:tetratricopeptide (TPR) repeat protein
MSVSAWRRCGVLVVLVAGPLFAAPVTADLTDLGRVDARTSALLIVGGGRGTIDGAVSWDLLPTDPGKPLAIRLVVEVSGRDLLRGSPEGILPVASAAYVLDGDGALVSFLSRGAVLSPEDREELHRVGWRWIDRIDLAPGAYSVRVIVRNHRTGAVFLDRFEVGLGKVAESESRVLPPFVDAGDTGWVRAVGAGADAEGAPSARAVLVNGVPTRFRVGMLGPADAWDELRVRLVDPAGRTVAEPGLSPSASATSVYRDYVMGAVDVPVGLYRLVVRVAGGDVRSASWASLEVLVVGAQTGDPWPSATLQPVDRPAADDVEERLRSRDIRHSYHQVIAAVARGEEVVARRTLADLERRAMQAAKPAVMVRLGEIQSSLAAKVARDEPRALWPLLWLHRTMNRYYRVRNESVLATHSSAVATELAGRLASQGGRDDLAFATDVLVDQANELVLIPAMRAAKRMLRRALQLDPDHVDAQIALGAVLERQGEIVEAATMFERATRLEPERSEATLRLAVNLDRAGRDSPARKLYRSLIGTAAPIWVRTVAVEQLARGFVEDGKAGEAVAVLRGAMEEIGPNPRLTIQLAQALDEAGETRRVTEVLQTLEADLDSDASPRLRYSEWPELGPRVDHQQLAGRAREALPALVHAVGAGEDGEEP